MSSIYSKPCESEATSEANNQNTNPKPDQLDIDLIDIIKTVITKLKTNDDGHSILKKLNFLAPCVTKVAIITNKQNFVLSVQTGFIRNPHRV